MLVRAEVARAAVHAAACLADEPDVVASEADAAGCTPGELLERAVRGAKLLADEAAIGNARGAIQVHGGMGFTWEVPLHLHLKRARVLSTTFGTPAEQAAALAAYAERACGRPHPIGVPPMTDPALIPADVVRTVPEGEVVYGMQLPIQSQSTLYVADWEKEAGPARAGPHRPGGRRVGLLLPRRVRPHRHPAPPGRGHGHHLVRHDGDAGLAGRAHHPHPPALPRADPRPAAPAAGGQGALDARPPLGGPPHRRSGRRPRARGVRTADGRLRRARPPHRRGRLRPGPLLHRGVPGPARPALPRPRHGSGTASGPPAPPAHLDRRLLPGGHPAHRGLR